VKTLFDLTHEQQEAARFLECNLSGVLWGDVGTGKTPVTCTAILDLLERFDIHRTLVVGTRLIADRVWNTEVKEWEHLTGLRVKRIVGTPKQRLAALNATDADIWVISRDNLCWLEEQFIRITGTDAKGKPIREQFRKFKWDTLILDESQSFKDQSASRTKSVRRLRQLVSRCYLLTGSLMPNGYRDLWSQYYLVDGGERLGKSENQFLEAFYIKSVLDGVPSYELRKGSAEKIDALIADVTFVMRDTRPKVPRNIIKVSLSEKEQKLYSKMARESVIDIGGETITAVNAGVLWGKLLQMSNGAVYDETGAYHVVHNAKIEALLELLESLPRPVIIGYGFVHDVERMRARLLELTHERVGLIRSNASLDAWKRREIDIGIMHPASAGHGLNDLYVTGCRHVVWFGYSPNREFYDQLNGRVIGGHRRAGGDDSYRIHHLHCANTLDDDALSIIDFKGDQALAAQTSIVKRKKEELLCANPRGPHRAASSRTAHLLQCRKPITTSKIS
jgi:SNF2 family DNA or RNA helicase